PTPPLASSPAFSVAVPAIIRLYPWKLDITRPITLNLWQVTSGLILWITTAVPHLLQVTCWCQQISGLNIQILILICVIGFSPTQRLTVRGRGKIGCIISRMRGGCQLFIELRVARPFLSSLRECQMVAWAVA